jgi:hypothetical protein
VILAKNTKIQCKKSSISCVGVCLKVLSYTPTTWVWKWQHRFDTHLSSIHADWGHQASTKSPTPHASASLCNTDQLKRSEWHPRGHRCLLAVAMHRVKFGTVPGLAPPRRAPTWSRWHKWRHKSQPWPPKNLHPVYLTAPISCPLFRRNEFA